MVSLDGTRRGFFFVPETTCGALVCIGTGV